MDMYEPSIGNPETHWQSQSQAGAQQPFAAAHLPAIGFVIVSRKVQQSMQHQHLDFG